jgi:hypothetical protein
MALTFGDWRLVVAQWTAQLDSAHREAWWMPDATFVFVFKQLNPSQARVIRTNEIVSFTFHVLFVINYIFHYNSSSRVME